MQYTCRDAHMQTLTVTHELTKPLHSVPLCHELRALAVHTTVLFHSNVLRALAVLFDRVMF